MDNREKSNQNLVAGKNKKEGGRRTNIVLSGWAREAALTLGDGVIAAGIETALRREQVLRACLNHSCRIWQPCWEKDSPPVCPKGNIAVIYRACGEGERFLVIGDKPSDIEAVAEIASQVYWQGQAIRVRACNTTPVGFEFKEYGLNWQVIGPDLYEDNHFLVAAKGGEQRQLLSLEDLEQKVWS